jgi:hypothetical protein
VSPYHYRWHGISVLNEDEHQIKPGGGVAYTACYDAIKAEVRAPPTWLFLHVRIRVA